MMNNPRVAFGETLVELGTENPNIVVLEADLGKSTMSCMFEQAHPSRFFEMGISEANMAAFAAGLAYYGKKPVINSFAMFALGRAYDQIRQSICIPNLNVVIQGSSAGLSDFGDGATHQMVEDIAIARALPNMTVFVPADSRQVKQMLRAAVNLDGPCYIRVPRSDMEDIYDETYSFAPGKPDIVRDGKDISILTNGVMVKQALCAAEILAQNGVDARIVNVNTLKPLADSTLIEIVKGTKAVVTAEEHSIIGGLGEVSAYALKNTNFPIECIAIPDCFGQSAQSHEQLLEHYGLTAEKIVSTVMSLKY